MKRIATVATVFGTVFLAGCTPPPWSAYLHTDEFSDVTFCRVASEEGFKKTFQYNLLSGAGGQIVTHEFFAEMRHDGPRIGVWGRFGVVMGDVQMRVDNNPTILITSQDTPIDTPINSIDAITIPAVKLPNVTESQQKAYEESLKQVGEIQKSALANVSPYKVATGRKAATLLEQIKTGKQLKFRVIGVNRATASTAQIEITSQFKDALRKCKLI